MRYARPRYTPHKSAVITRYYMPLFASPLSLLLAFITRLYADHFIVITTYFSEATYYAAIALPLLAVTTLLERCRRCWRLNSAATEFREDIC